MSHPDITQSLRAAVIEALSRLGGVGALEVCETILIRNGAYYGRRFHTAAGHADWLVEQNQATLYRPDGTIVEVLQVPAPNGGLTKAA